jgi:hypothetical protein
MIPDALSHLKRLNRALRNALFFLSRRPPAPVPASLIATPQNTKLATS